MGWSDVKIAVRYIHPSEGNVLDAIEGFSVRVVAEPVATRLSYVFQCYAQAE
jgi:hypothetical protein